LFRFIYYIWYSSATISNTTKSNSERTCR